MTDYTDMDKQVLRDFANATDTDQKAMLFDSIMDLLTDAVEADDPVFIKTYARLATELWNNYEDEEQA